MVSGWREPFLAAAVQMTARDDVPKNLAEVAAWTRKAHARGASLVVWPENFSFLGPEARKVGEAAQIAQVSEVALAALSRELGITIVGGGYPVPSPVAGRVFNRLAVFAPTGGALARYDKIHLFEVDIPGAVTLREADTVMPGTDAVVADAGPLGRIGCSICYDLRFPEMYRRLIDRDADYFVAPAAFTAETGKDHWHLLLRARAVENVTYVIAAAQTGRHNDKRQSYGHACIVDPWGTVLADAGEAPGLALAEIDPARIAVLRQRMPSLANRVL
jgi:deaminated glutathione amidase